MYEIMLLPHFRKKMLSVLCILGLLCIASAMYGFINQETIANNTIETIAVICFLFFGLSIPSFFLFKSSRVKCPKCNSTLESTIEISERPRFFICHDCKVLWNTNLVLSDDAANNEDTINIDNTWFRLKQNDTKFGVSIYLSNVDDIKSEKAAISRDLIIKSFLSNSEVELKIDYVKIKRAPAQAEKIGLIPLRDFRKWLDKSFEVT